MPISKQDIVDALWKEREQALHKVAQCNAALAAFSVPVEEPTTEGGFLKPAPEESKPETKPQKKPISLDNINRAKARVKRFDKPFTRSQLAEAMGVANNTAGLAIEVLTDEGWIELAEDRPNTKGGKLFRYLPAGKDPTHKPRGETPGNNGGGKGEAIAGTGKGLRSADHDINAIIRKLRADDWLVTKTGSDHYRATKGIKQVRFSATPPGQQAISAIKSNLRNAGARI